MYYHVLATDGQRYGPVDIDTLVQWVAQGRIVASTMLIERGTERQMQADSIDAVAAALRKSAGTQAGVVIERGPSDFPTMTQGPTGPAQPPMPGVPPVPAPPYAVDGRRVGRKSKIVAGLFGILLPFGVHRFYLGYVGIGILQVLTFPCGVGAVWCFVEGVICLCGGMRDADGYELRD